MLKKSLLLSTLGAVLFVAAPAHATDDKSLPAMACTKIGTDGLLTLDTWGRISNMGVTQTLKVGCPLPKDHHSSNASLVAARVSVTDRTISGQVACTLQSRSADGTVGWSNFQASGVGNAPIGYIDLNFPSVGSQQGGYYYLECTIPPRGSSTGPASGMASIWISEP